MLILYKDYKDQEVRIPNINKVILEFDFKRYMNPLKLAEMKKNSNYQFCSDLISSFIHTHMNERCTKISRKFLLHALRASRDLLLFKGYRELNVSRFRRTLDLSRECIVTVYGCQTRGLLNSRVKAAADLLKIIDTKIHFVFSGYAPEIASNNIANEADYMENRFYDFSKLYRKLTHNSKLDKITTSHLNIENKSTRTEQNIEKILELPMIKHAEKPINFFMVSSNFHHMKLVDILETKMKEKGIDTIDKVYVIGSEEITKVKKVCLRGQYGKNLFYNLYNAIFQLPD